MSLELCTWCGEPVALGSELCGKCLAAQKQAEQDLHKQQSSLPAPVEKPSFAMTVLSTTGKVLWIAGKVIVMFVLAWALLIAGLGGTCALIFATNGALGVLPFALVLLGIAFGIGCLLQYMIKNDTKNAIAKARKIASPVQTDDPWPKDDHDLDPSSQTHGVPHSANESQPVTDSSTPVTENQPPEDKSSEKEDPDNVDRQSP
jgi:hypothetical protein